MAWHLPRREHVVYARNPIVVVLAQLRFHPILKVAASIPDFQDRVRARFPSYEEALGQTVELQSPNSVRIQNEKQFLFRTVDGNSTASLSTSSLSLECRAHSSREALIADLQVALTALETVYAPIVPTRLGMRYVDVIDRQRTSGDLGREVAWNELIADSFTQMPAGLADLDGTVFSNEINSPLPHGAMTLRYGLMPLVPGAVPTFRLDFDRYVDGTFPIGTAPDLLREFSDDVYALFQGAIGPALREWMGHEVGREG